MRRPIRETGLAGWGGRIRTSAWRNQNPIVSLLKSTLIQKNKRNCRRAISIAYIPIRNRFRLNRSPRLVFTHYEHAPESCGLSQLFSPVAYRGFTDPAGNGVQFEIFMPRTAPKRWHQCNVTRRARSSMKERTKCQGRCNVSVWKAGSS
jgi:hypothetical protein